MALLAGGEGAEGGKGKGDVPEDNVGLGDGGVLGKEGDDGVGVCGGESGEERGGVEDAGVEEVGGVYESSVCLQVG